MIPYTPPPTRLFPEWPCGRYLLYVYRFSNGPLYAFASSLN